LSKIVTTLTALSLVMALGAHCRAQDGGERAYALGRLVEFTSEDGGEKADFDVVSVKVEGELLKKFSASVTYLKVIATFNGPESDYVLLRTSMGNGACAGGDLYALRFYTYGQANNEGVGLEVSPALTTCLGEFPTVRFEYDNQANVVIGIAGYELKGDPWVRWVPQAKQKGSVPRRRGK
jgi:hypothetical protein